MPNSVAVGKMALRFCRDCHIGATIERACESSIIVRKIARQVSDTA
jgi:hypothetical protein